MISNYYSFYKVPQFKETLDGAKYTPKKSQQIKNKKRHIAKKKSKSK